MIAPTRTSIILLAHGSRAPAVVSELALLAAQTHVEGATVRYAFLQLCAPLLPTIIDQEADAGSTQIVVLPVFLTAGRHVQDDIPQEIRAAQLRWPAVHLEVTPHMGAASGLAALLSQHVLNTSELIVG